MTEVREEEKEKPKSRFAAFMGKKLGKMPVWVVFAVGFAAIAAVIIFAISSAGSSAEGEAAAAAAEETYAVKVTQISERGGEQVLYYIGTVQPEETQQASYAGISEVTAVYVGAGDSVQKGTALAAVDPGNTETSVRNAKTTLDQAKSAQVEAQQNYDNAVAQQTRYNELVAIKQARDDAYAENAAAQADTTLSQSEKDAKLKAYQDAQTDYDAVADELNDYEQVALSNGYPDASAYYASRVRVTAASLDEANSTLSTAQQNYDDAVKELDKCTVYSELNGYIIGIYTDVGEVATPLNPIVVVGTDASVAVVGVSAGDIRSVAVGQACEITVNGTLHTGKVTKISAVPDTDSRTYDVTVSLPKSESRYLIGDIAAVSINVGEKYGVWLPINVIMNDGEDYVYVVENDRAMKKYIKITDISNDYVCVTGLESGGAVVTDGMKYLKSGVLVTVVD